jgi:uncharacterized protein with PQ loop repeat
MIILGTLGALFFAVCAFPQVYYIYKTNNTAAMSLSFISLWALGEIFMWAYVILQNGLTGDWQWPLHINYALNAIALSYLLYKKIVNTTFKGMPWKEVFWR